MRRLEMWSALCGAAVLTLSGMAAAQTTQPVSHGRFEQVPVLMPKGEPQRVVIWLTGTGNNVMASNVPHTAPKVRLKFAISRSLLARRHCWWRSARSLID